jgi:DNA-binding beta-propeller fold protein YncE
MRFLTIATMILAWVWPGLLLRGEAQAPHRLLYVAVPGIRDYLQYGGHGVLIYDIDAGHKFLRRIPAAGLGAKGQPLNVKGICASAATQRLYVSTIETMECFDLATDKLLWEKHYEKGCDRMSITADGKKLFTPSFEKDFWHVIDGETGEDIQRIPTEKHAHNTVVSIDGKEAYLADLGSRMVQVVDTTTLKVVRSVGPFGNFVRPFTVNGVHSLGYMNVNDLLGFEIADLNTGKVLHRLEVPGFQKGPVARHGCPSHGVGLTPDEREVWVCDSHNKQLHVYDNTASPPKYVQSLAVRDEPGWVTFSLDGKLAYPSTGEVFDVPSHQIITTLKDENGGPVHSEKMLEIQMDANGKAVAVGDQFGLGRVR